MEINTDILKAALLCAGNEPSRYYLNGVLIDAAGYVVSTDGHRLFIAKLPEPTGTEDFIIPRDVMKQIVASKLDYVAVTPTQIGNIVYQPIDATFPTWRHVLPKTEMASDTPAQFNPAYVADMGKIAKALGDKTGYCHIHHNGDSPAVVTFGRNDCFAVLMPIRTGHTPENNYDRLRAAMAL